MNFSKVRGTLVGADLSAFRGFHDITLILLMHIIGPGEPARYPDVLVKVHYKTASRDY